MRTNEKIKLFSSGIKRTIAVQSEATFEVRIAASQPDVADIGVFIHTMVRWKHRHPKSKI